MTAARFFEPIMLRWREAAPRERALVAAFMAIAAFALALSLMDQADVTREAALTARADRVAAEETAALRADPTFRARALAAAEKERAWAYPGATATIAALELASDLETIAQTAGLGDARADAAPSEEAAGAVLMPVRATLEAEFTWPGFVDLLDALTQSERALWPSEAEVVQNDQGARLRLVVAAPHMPEGVAP